MSNLRCSTRISREMDNPRRFKVATKTNREVWRVHIHAINKKAKMRVEGVWVGLSSLVEITFFSLGTILKRFRGKEVENKKDLLTLTILA